ncbi:MAG TPA: phosphopyruvate hydratase [Candidatus Dojkabacteria bacterium]|nr:phosphopyruvate hydratase [Candidatus Dojkabacteria bacterium]
MKITKLYAEEILDSRGNPTIKCNIWLENGKIVSACVPSGASTGKYEAHELRDGDNSRYLGQGVLKAITNVNEKISPLFVGKELRSIEECDRILIELDGSENKSNLGANAILSVSLAYVRALSELENIPLYKYIADIFNNSLTVKEMPKLMINVINGGKHAKGSSDIQEYMFIPNGAASVQQAVQWGSECFHNLGKILQNAGYSTTVGDEGGYAPSLGSNERPLELMTQAIIDSNLRLGTDISLAIDCAASNFYADGKYSLSIENKTMSSEELCQMYGIWISKYPIISIEDAFAEDDWDGFKLFEETYGNRILNVGDDLYVTNVIRLKQGIELKASNAVLIKPNQIGTFTETKNALELATNSGMKTIMSHRSGETDDTFIADFAVGACTNYIKAGSMSRGERVAKYNRLMSIERELEKAYPV